MVPPTILSGTAVRFAGTAEANKASALHPNLLLGSSSSVVSALRLLVVTLSM
jgi:hypothetical protein